MEALFTSGKYKECLESANNFLLSNPDDFNAISHKGACLYKLGFYDEAIETFNQGLLIKQDAFFLWVFRGDCFYELGAYQKAFSDYWISLRLEPQNGAVLDKCARSLFRMGEEEYALDYIKKAVNAGESPEPVVVMINMLDRMGFSSYARVIARMGKEKFPKDSRFKEYLEAVSRGDDYWARYGDAKRN